MFRDDQVTNFTFPFSLLFVVCLQLFVYATLLQIYASKECSLKRIRQLQLPC